MSYHVDMCLNECFGISASDKKIGHLDLHFMPHTPVQKYVPLVVYADVCPTITLLYV